MIDSFYKVTVRQDDNRHLDTFCLLSCVISIPTFSTDASTRDIALVTNITTEIPATEKLRQSQSCLSVLQMEVLQLLKQNPRYVGQYRANTLKPGYTGFIPQRAYRCGSTYGNDAAECMHAFCETNKKVILKNAELRLQITSSPKLKPIVSDQEVTRAIHNYCERREFSLKGKYRYEKYFCSFSTPIWNIYFPILKFNYS
ncbi:UNVERIFIED_CONTAM: hypothetical protein FKN15_033439 [Acipenser sinensis]